MFETDKLFVIAEILLADKIEIYMDDVFSYYEEAVEFMREYKLSERDYEIMTLDAFIEEYGDRQFWKGYNIGD